MTPPTDSIKEHRVSSDLEKATLRTWLRMLACTNIVEGRVKGLLRENFDTTLPRFDLLAQLDSSRKDFPNGLSMSDLSRRMMVTNGNITGLVDRLARERLISRSVDPNDRRTQLVRITDSGRESLERMTPNHQSWISSMFSALSEAERKQLYELVGKLKASAQAANINKGIE